MTFAPTDSPEGVQADAVLQFLMGINLTDAEADFRGVLENVAEDPTAPKISDLTIATIAVLMAMGGTPWPVVMRTLTHLAKRPEELLHKDAVAIVNGGFLLLPSGTEGVIHLDLTTLREVDDVGPPFVSTVYSCTAIWDRAVEIMQAP